MALPGQREGRTAFWSLCNCTGLQTFIRLLLVATMATDCPHKDRISVSLYKAASISKCSIFRQRLSKRPKNTWDGEAPCSSQRRLKHAEYRAPASVAGKYVRYWNSLWKSWLLKANITQVSISLAKCLWIFLRAWVSAGIASRLEFRNHLVQEAIAVAWVVDAASYDWSQKWKKEITAPGGTNLNVSLLLVWAKQIFVSKSPLQRKKFITESKLAIWFGNRQVTTVSDNMFTEIHWLDGIAKGMYLHRPFITTKEVQTKICTSKSTRKYLYHLIITTDTSLPSRYLLEVCIMKVFSVRSGEQIAGKLWWVKKLHMSSQLQFQFPLMRTVLLSWMWWSMTSWWSCVSY